MKKIAIVLFSLILMVGYFFFIPDEIPNKVDAQVVTRGGDEFKMDMNISIASEASFIGENANDWSGYSVSGAGDVNGDGYDDILIGAKNDHEGGSAAGQTYLIMGKASGWAMDTDLSNADASFIGEDDYDYSGWSVSGAGDVNGDGYDDILIGAYGDKDGGSFAGQTYLILGKASGWAMDTDLSNVDASFIGEDEWDYSGFSVSGAGDVNGDGYDDILIGAIYNDDGGSNAGQTYLILGKASGWAMDTDLSNADASFIGEDEYDLSGRSVSGAGDVNGDGYDDILIGAFYDDDGGSNAGQTYLILGKASGWAMDTDLSNVYASFIGEDAGDWSGFVVADAGDVNGDGYDDILIGAHENDDGGSIAGQTYLIIRLTNTEPLEVYSIDSYSDPLFTNNIDKIDLNEIIYIELEGLDCNNVRQDVAWINVTSTSSITSPIHIPLVETDRNTGTYQGHFKVTPPLDYLEYLTITSQKDPTKTATIQIHTPVLIKPNISHYIWTEDKYEKIDLGNSGYGTVSEWYFKSNGNWLVWDEAEQVVSGTPDNSFVGIYWVNVSANDGMGHMDSVNFTIEVLNNAPSILTEDERVAHEEVPYQVDYDCDDDGQGNIRWTISPSDINWLNIDTSTGILSGTPSNDDVGSYDLNISVDDGNGGLDWTEFTLEVLDVNDPPMITTDPITTINQGDHYYLEFTAVDEDDVNIFEWAVISSAGFLEINTGCCVNKMGI